MNDAFEPLAERIHTRIWLEEPEPDNDFATRAAYCHGYDVYGEMLGRASWAEMMLLLFRGERPSAAEARLFDTLAVALANAGPRDAANHAAMCGGVGGSTAASCLMAALAVGAGQNAGGREIFLAMQGWQRRGIDIAAWRRDLAESPADVASIWPRPEHPPGFEAHGSRCATIVAQTLATLARLGPGPRLPWLDQQREAIEAIAGRPLAMAGVAAAVLADLSLAPEQGEMLYLLLRLPGAAAHALEQHLGYKRFPFFALDTEEASA